jgi:hypothetical protein
VQTGNIVAGFSVSDGLILGLMAVTFLVLIGIVLALRKGR